MDTLKATWTGIRPLVLHNGLMIDPTYPPVIAIKKITRKGSRKMTESDYQERDRLEWMGSLYWLDECGIYIPSDNIERCIQLGAQKSRQGKEVQAAVFVADEIVKVGHSGPKTREAMYADPRFTLRRPVSLKGNRIIRVRPMIPTNWSISFTLEFDDSVVSKKDVMTAMFNAGALVGLGDWRPKFGRFTVDA